MNINYYKEDLPNDIVLRGSIAIDTEAMGLNLFRDRLCLVQISDAEQNVYCVHFANNSEYNCPNLKKVLKDASILKIFHFARFDISKLISALKIEPRNIFCTKIASFLVRTYTSNHGLKDLCKELLGIKLDKEEQTSDWGAEILRPEQLEYAAKDVIYLHAIKEKLELMLEREGRKELAHNCFEFLTTRVYLDLLGMETMDVFSYSLKK